MTQDLLGHPQFALTAGATLYRIHSSRFGPWRFSKAGNSRFDLTNDQTPLGTCYFGEDPLAAFVEVFRDFIGRPLPRSELDQRRLFSVTWPTVASLADLTRHASQEYGADASVSAGDPRHYGAPQVFAHRCATAGFAGIRYRVRHDVEQELFGLALFGPATLLPSSPLPAGRSTAIPDDLLATAASTFGFRFPGPLLDPGPLQTGL